MPGEPTTRTHSAGDWRDMSAFCFVNEPVSSGTLTADPATLAVDVAVLEKMEDALDRAVAIAALEDVANYPEVSWADVKQQLKL